MSDHAVSAGNTGQDDPTPFDHLISETAATAFGAGFTTTFRGYDKEEVDAAIAGLDARVRAAADEVAQLKQHQRRAGAAVAQSRAKAERLEAELHAAAERHQAEIEEAVAARQAEADATLAARQEELERLQAALAEAEGGRRAEAEAFAARQEEDDAAERLRGELELANAKLADAEQRVQALSDELVGATTESPNRQQFEEVLRVAEDQASLLIRNATIQGDRLLEAAREEIANRRASAQAEAEAIISHAQHDAQQVRLKIDTESTAHEARVEREAAHAAEKLSQAEREAAAIRSEAEKGAAVLRSTVARETARDRAEAEEAVRELRLRALEFEASLTRRQDDAHQEFLVLHNQAVAHAERITQDANDQVAASLEHAQRVAVKAEDFERLMRAQSKQIEADAQLRAREHLEQAHVKAERIIDLVTSHSQAVLRDAEDRTRQLRWQQHQLMSFMAEVKELIRPDGLLAPAPSAVADEPGEQEVHGSEHAPESSPEGEDHDAERDQNSNEPDEH
ncbi:DivIVA domain-containing protein [Microbacterium sp. E-13]|uniref:DivIVA domain-containing protein n=1 Tax=Microbacterium sp. E-13 TaxID=3404048 RepID=UPI003CEADD70